MLKVRCEVVAVCQPPPGYISQTISVQFTGGNCEFDRNAQLPNGTTVRICPPSGCSCAALMFDSPCQALVGQVYLNLFLDGTSAVNATGVNSVLGTIGIASINVLYGKLYLYFSSSTNITWPLTMFPVLEVVRPQPGGPTMAGIQFWLAGGGSFSFTGSGFARLRASATLETTYGNPSQWQNSDLRTLAPGVQCVGVVYVPSNVVSLAGLDNLVDGVAGSSSSNIIIDSRLSPVLTNISALSRYGRCGTATPLPSTHPSRPLIQVANCPGATLSTWPAICAYIASGACP